MTLQPGQTLLHYRLVDKEVAIKVLPEAVAAHPERLARFSREARLLASLNDPHIRQLPTTTSRPTASASSWSPPRSARPAPSTWS
jgi:hypothetical protein